MLCFALAPAFASACPSAGGMRLFVPLAAPNGAAAGRGEVRLDDIMIDPSAPPGSAASLLRACAAGDRIALRRLYEQQADRLYGIALRIVRHPPLAADALHDSFLNIWRNAAQFDPARGNAEAWLTGVVRNRALDLVRRDSREMTGIELPDRADESAGAFDQLAQTREAEALHRCLALLEGEKRRLVTMAFMDGLTHVELSDRLRVPLGTVKSSIRRALIALRRCLDA
jgi:RNA polymerase sigma-70 factor (ECF subfamily)